MCISADPGLRQGRGGAWDHRRCGTCSGNSPNPSHFGRGRPFLQNQGLVASCSSQATPAAADLSCGSNRALRPWQCPFMEVQGCRLPGLETPQTLPCSSQAATQATADLSCSLNKALRPWLPCSLRPWQCPFMEVQGSRLPGLETPQTVPCSCTLIPTILRLATKGGSTGGFILCSLILTGSRRKLWLNSPRNC